MYNKKKGFTELHNTELSIHVGEQAQHMDLFEAYVCQGR